MLFSAYSVDTCGQTIELREQCLAALKILFLCLSKTSKYIWKNMIEPKSNFVVFQTQRANFLYKYFHEVPFYGQINLKKRKFSLDTDNVVIARYL